MCLSRAETRTKNSLTTLNNLVQLLIVLIWYCGIQDFPCRELGGNLTLVYPKQWTPNSSSEFLALLHHIQAKTFVLSLGTMERNITQSFLNMSLQNYWMFLLRIKRSRLAYTYIYLYIHSSTWKHRRS